ncbi:Glycolate dehydrogenase [Heyndrickxia coagulans]|nr:Glycolate dehydrogenase [Heyndrickxia coagulans]
MIETGAKEKLIQVVGRENYDDTQAGRLVYSYDASPQFQVMPDAVVAPRNKAEVQAVVKLCNEYRIPVVPRGSGSNLCAGTCPVEGGLCSFSSI